MKTRKNFDGKTFGKLTIICDSEDRCNPCGTKNRMIFCECECGEKVNVQLAHLKRGNTKSCGCLQKEIMSKRNFIHGKSSTRIYAIWKSMIQRCNNLNNKAYKNYGGRGISVCERWKKLENFHKDMGETPLLMIAIS